MSTYQANIYPLNTANPTVANADRSRKSIAVCFSGGGSRALTCAWGQLIGLYGMKDQSGTRLLDDVRYISSVSGGTWASALYTFHSRDLSDDIFLGKSFAPSMLYYNSNVEGGKNVSVMSPSALGSVPQNFSNLLNSNIMENIITEFLVISVLNNIPLSESLKWLWMFIVGQDVLAGFGLYTYASTHQGLPWNYPDAKYFSLSEAYAEKEIFNGQQPPPTNSFIYARSTPDGKPATPMLIVNTNVVGRNCPSDNMSAPMQIPVQASPVAAGIYGANPCASDTPGGGATESFSFTSTLSSQVNEERVDADFSRAYSIVDITSCSSAFFAASLAEPVSQLIQSLSAMKDAQLEETIARFAPKSAALASAQLLNAKAFRAQLTSARGSETLAAGLSDVVPQYNYWPVGTASQGSSANKDSQFTDGGSMDNLGVAGLLAQVQGSIRNIISFANGTDSPKMIDGQVVAALQMAPLFGIAYDGKSTFKPYLPDGVNPFTSKTDPIGFLQVFDNSKGQFDALRNGIYTANGSDANTSPAFYLQTLTLVDNDLLGIKASSQPINVLWIQNTRVTDWQNQITDPVLAEKIQEGQKPNIDPLREFANFPYYDTMWKVHLNAAETNTLAQMWAWCVGNEQSPLSTAIQKMFAEAGN